MQDKVPQCVSSIRRKVTPTRAADLVSIESHAPMDVVCIDFLKLEQQKVAMKTFWSSRITSPDMHKMCQQETKQQQLLPGLYLMVSLFTMDF